jgi:phosphoglycolate phosphatase
MPQADSDTLELWRQDFLAHYEKNSYRDSKLFDGIVELLAFLDRKDIPWGIVTNKPEYLTRPILSAAGLDESIACLVCGDTIEQRKPHPAPVLLACQKLGVRAADTLMVGDHLGDLEAGKAAGVKTCAVLYGYGSTEFSKSENQALLNGAFMTESPQSLLAWLQGELA